MNPDFRDMLSALSEAGAEFLVVGAYALAAHGLPRATGDLDVWVKPDAENARRVRRALQRFGASLVDLAAEDLERPGVVMQIGVAPVRIDLLTGIDGVSFDEAWPARMVRSIGGLDVPILSREHLLKNKLATGRDRDLADVRWLEKET